MKVFSPGEVAKILRCSPKKVRKLFDSGRLEGYRTSKSKYRKIYIASLRRFTAECGFTSAIKRLAPKIFIFTSHPFLEKNIRQHYDSLNQLVFVSSATNLFDAGMSFGDKEPDVIIVSLAFGKPAKDFLGIVLKRKPTMKNIVLIADYEKTSFGKKILVVLPMNLDLNVLEREIEHLLP